MLASNPHHATPTMLLLLRMFPPTPPPLYTPEHIKTENTKTYANTRVTFGTPPGNATPYRAGPAHHQDARSRTPDRSPTNNAVEEIKKAATYISQKFQGRKFKGGSRSVLLYLPEFDDVCTNILQIPPSNHHTRISLFANVLEGAAHTLFLKRKHELRTNGELVCLMQDTYNHDARQTQILD